jgi:hypothetical protein
MVIVHIGAAADLGDAQIACAFNFDQLVQRVAQCPFRCEARQRPQLVEFRAPVGGILEFVAVGVLNRPGFRGGHLV